MEKGEEEYTSCEACSRLPLHIQIVENAAKKDKARRGEMWKARGA